MLGVKTQPSMSVDLSQWQHHQNASLSQPDALVQIRSFVEPSGPQAARPWSEELSRLSDFHQFHNLSLYHSQTLIACLSLTLLFSLSLTVLSFGNAAVKKTVLCKWKGHFSLLLPQSRPALHAFLPLYHVNILLLQDWRVWQSDPRIFATLWPLLTSSMVEVTKWWEKSDQDELACQPEPSCCDHSIYYKVCMPFSFISTMINLSLSTASILHLFSKTAY